MKYCVKCGHELAEGAKFCPACGHPVEQQEQERKKPTQVEAAVVNQEVPVEPETTQQKQEEHHEAETDQQVENEQPQLGFVGSVQYIMQHVFDFNGGEPESRKSVFWWGFLAVFLLNLAFVGIPAVGTLLCWATTILLVSAVMRRLDYIGQNRGIGWLSLIPVVGIYPFFLMLMDKKG